MPTKVGRGPNHGHTRANGWRSRTYRIWTGMWERCIYPTNKRYADYGGRGITVCQRWQDFRNFLADMGEAPEGLTLDRKNNSKGYSPKNCRWATAHEQQQNMRSNVNLEYKGETFCAREWSRRLGIKYITLLARIYRGWPVEQALGAPLQRGIRPSNRILAT